MPHSTRPEAALPMLAALTAIVAPLAAVLTAALAGPPTHAASKVPETPSIDRLVERLSSDVYLERVEAQEKLKRAGAAAVPALRRAAQGADAEAAARAGEILRWLAAHRTQQHGGLDPRTFATLRRALAAAPSDPIWHEPAELVAVLQEAAAIVLEDRAAALALELAARLLDRGVHTDAMARALVRLARTTSGPESAKAVRQHLLGSLLRRLSQPRVPVSGLLLEALQASVASRSVDAPGVAQVAAWLADHTQRTEAVPADHAAVVRPTTILALLEHGGLTPSATDALIDATLARLKARQSPQAQWLGALEYLATSPPAGGRTVHAVVSTLISLIDGRPAATVPIRRVLETSTGRRATGNTTAQLREDWRQWWAEAGRGGTWQAPRADPLYEVVICSLRTAPAPAEATFTGAQFQHERTPIGFRHPVSGGWLWFYLIEGAQGATPTSHDEIAVRIVDWGWQAHEPPPAWTPPVPIRLDRFYVTASESAGRRDLTMFRVRKARRQAVPGRGVVRGGRPADWVEHLIHAVGDAAPDQAREIIGALDQLPGRRARSALVRIARDGTADLALDAAGRLAAKNDPAGKAELVAQAAGAAVPIACRAALALARHGSLRGAEALVARKFDQRQIKSVSATLETIARLPKLDGRALAHEIGRRCLADEHQRVWRLERFVPILQRLTGMRFGWRSDAVADVRSQALAKWRDWITRGRLDALTP